MCGSIVLMSRQPSPLFLDLSQRPTASSGTCFPSRYLNPLVGPATIALNDAALFSPKGNRNGTSPRSSPYGDNSGAADSFPTIEWTSPEKCLDGSEEQDIISHRLSWDHTRPCPRGKLVRSISLVSNILEEIKSQRKQHKKKSPARKRARKILLAVPMSTPQNKSRTTQRCCDSDGNKRFISLSLPKTIKGIQASRMASTKQYIL